MSIIDCESSTETIDLEPGVHRGLSFDDYRSISAVSASALKAFVLDSPFHGKAIFDRVCDDKPRVDFALGTALHVATLTPELESELVIEGPDKARNTKEWKAFAAEHPDKLCLKPTEARNVRGMSDSIRANKGVSTLVAACPDRELTIVWDDEATGLRCKGRIDLYGQADGLLMDLKTTADADATKFAKTAANLGYDIQFAFYARGLKACGLPFERAGVLVVEQSAPWWCGACELSPAWFEAGASKVHKALDRWKWHASRNKPWPGYWQGILQLDLPAWAG